MRKLITPKQFFRFTMENTETRQRILDVALERFFRFGFNAVTVDEIAAELGMSKRTLYRHFPGKKDLLREGLERTVGRISEGLRGIVEAESEEPVAKLASAMRFLVERLPRPERRFFQDMARSVPDVWRVVEAKRAEVLRERFGRLFREGVQAGALREDVDPGFLLEVFLTLIHNLIRPETLAEMPLSAAQAFEKLTSILMVGVLTEPAAARFRGKTKGEAVS